MVGKKIGLLSVVRLHTVLKKYGCVWFCKCDCGNTTIVQGHHLRQGHTKSCGCLVKFTIGNTPKNKTHGMSNTKTYKSWESMWSRCKNKNHGDFHNYGGRGITVCKRWLKFENFFKDMGTRPPNKTLDRINTNGNYEPKNCRWATLHTQNRNRRDNVWITINGDRKIMEDWAKEFKTPANNFIKKYKIKKEQINRGY